MFATLDDLFRKAEENGQNVADYIAQQQALNSGSSIEIVFKRMEQNLSVMEGAVREGLRPDAKTLTGLVGPDAHKLQHRLEEGQLMTGSFVGKVLAYAYATATVNASMGKIVAAPTAGSSGVLPGVVIAAGEQYGYDRNQLCKALLVASAIGLVISQKATLAGAAGGCQAECGAGAAMAAGALAYLRGGTHDQIKSAVALALKNLLGLACDPVAGLVEVPCIKRNATCAAHAVVAADLAMSGIDSAIPADEVIDAMASVGRMLPTELRETARGGLAVTPTGLRIAEDVRMKSQ